MARAWSGARRGRCRPGSSSSPTVNLSMPWLGRIRRGPGCQTRKGSRWRERKMTVAKEMRVVKDVTCPFCGVTCDDLEVHVEDGKIRDVKNACVLGKDTFLHHLEGLATPRIDGKPASIEACIEAAADILARAKYPLIYGLDSTELHAHRKAIELAELIGANI